MKKIVAIICCVAICFSLFGCGNGSVNSRLDKDGNIIGTSSSFKIFSSDSGFDDFMNEYFQRHSRSGDLSVGWQRLGDGATYQKVWESDSLVWFDSTVSGLRDYDGMKNLENFLYNIEVDKFGYVYSLSAWPLDGTTTSVLQGQGWSFPTYKQLNTYGVEFSDSVSGWTVNEEYSPSYNGGFLVDSFFGGTDESYFLQSSEFEGIDSFLAPYMEIDLRITDNGNNTSMDSSNIEDWYFCWQTEDSNEWYEVSQFEYTSNPEVQGFYNIYRSYFHMFLNENWANKNIIRLGIKIVPKSGERLNIDVKMNYCRMMTDARMAINQDCYISSLEKYVAYTNDTTVLKDCITKARRAMLFYLDALDGKNGLIDLSYMPGHDTGEGLGHGNMSGFWDTIRGCTKNLESNYSFYAALRSLANLERMVIDSGIVVTEQATVKHPYLNGPDLVYSETPESLERLANTVKTNICKDCCDGGFWNPETGRFVYGLYDDNWKMGKKGEPFDYGYTDYNLQCVYLGIPTEEQAKSVMAWINGDRTVEGDTSLDEDIYFYEFAPRYSTKDNYYDFINEWSGSDSIGWSWQCPDGGVAMHVSFYDIISRTNVFGANNSFGRLKEIQKWYEEVKSYNGLTGKSFYAAYYTEKQLESTSVNEYKQYTMQGGGPNGAVGLTDEFTEASLLYATVPYSYLGLDASKFKVLNVSPNLPDGLDYLGAENLRYSEINYNLLVTNNQVIISGLSKDADGETVEITFKKPSKNFKVQIDGVETANYVVDGDYVKVTVPFKKVNVTIG